LRGQTDCFIYSELLVDLHDNPTEVEEVNKDLIFENPNHPENDQPLAKFVLSGVGEKLLDQ
jgi:hypothetical protein